MNKYDCEQAFRRLDDYLDRELSSEEIQLVRGHLAECKMCAEEFVFEERVLAQVKEKVRRISVPETLAGRVREALATERAAV